MNSCKLKLGVLTANEANEVLSGLVCCASGAKLMIIEGSIRGALLTFRQYVL